MLWFLNQISFNPLWPQKKTFSVFLHRFFFCENQTDLVIEIQLVKICPEPLQKKSVEKNPRFSCFWVGSCKVFYGLSSGWVQKINLCKKIQPGSKLKSRHSFWETENCQREEISFGHKRLDETNKNLFVREVNLPKKPCLERLKYRISLLKPTLNLLLHSRWLKLNDSERLCIS